MAHRSTPRPRIQRLTLRRVPRGWALQVDHLEEPAWVVSTREKGLRAATAAARDLGAELVVAPATEEVPACA